MLALAYDAALRREELCCLRTDDVDPGHRTLRVRAETTKTRRERVVPYSAPTGLLLADYLAHRAAISRARGPLFLYESRRNYAEPLSLWSWSKIVRRVALEADVPRFSTHTTRHLCLTDLARMAWVHDQQAAEQARAHPGAYRRRRCDFAAPVRRHHHRPGLGPGHRHPRKPPPGSASRRLTSQPAGHQAGGRGEPCAALRNHGYLDAHHGQPRPSSPQPDYALMGTNPITAMQGQTTDAAPA
jgi:hypothetical protein